MLSHVLSVEDIAAMSDAALAAFMAKNRRADGDFELPVDGWDKFSKDERDSLKERLITQQRALAQSPALPIDLNHLDALLLQVSSGDETVRLRASRSLSPPFDSYAASRTREREAYNDLVKDGGRPLYLLDLLDEVSRKPDDYYELLQPWQCDFAGMNELWDSSGTSANTWEAFQKQWARWQDFRKWQRDNRWLEDDNSGFLAYVERRKDHVKENFTKSGGIKRLAEIEADPSHLKPDWQEWQRQRDMRRRYCREFHGGDKFCNYADAVQHRLAQHGFTRPIQLNETPKQQDKLTTWIEYLYFESWWLDRHVCTIERLQPEEDRAWQKLKDSKVLQLHETREFLRTDQCAIQGQTEEDQAWKAVERAQVTAKQVSRSTDPHLYCLSIPEPECISRIQAAIHELMLAKGQLESIKKRNNLVTEFVCGTYNIHIAKRDAACHQLLFSWILKQVPLIEAESSPIKVMENGSKGTKRTKRRLNLDDDGVELLGPKKQKFGRSGFRFCSDNSAAASDQKEAQAQNSPTMHSLQTPGACAAAPPLHMLRRSARIAARLATSATVLMLQPSPKRLRLRETTAPTRTEGLKLLGPNLHREVEKGSRLAPGSVGAQGPLAPGKVSKGRGDMPWSYGA